jgi:hypothetical protein
MPAACRLALALRARCVARDLKRSRLFSIRSSFLDPLDIPPADSSRPPTFSAADAARQFAAAPALERVRILQKLAPLDAVQLAARNRGQGALIALLSSSAASCARFAAALDARGLEALLGAVAEEAFLSGAAQSARVAPVVLPGVLARVADLLWAAPSPFDAALAAAACRALSTNACTSPDFARALDAVLASLLGGPDGGAAFAAGVGIVRWSHLFEALGDGCRASASAAARALAALPPAALAAPADAVERIVANALRAGVDGAACAALADALLAAQQCATESAPAARDSLKAETELLRSMCTAASAATWAEPARAASPLHLPSATAAGLAAAVKRINARLSLLRASPTGPRAPGAVTHTARAVLRLLEPAPATPAGMSAGAPALSPDDERACRRFFGRSLGSALAPGGALKAVNALLAGARCLLVLRRLYAHDAARLPPPLDTEALNTLHDAASLHRDASSGWIEAPSAAGGERFEASFAGAVALACAQASVGSAAAALGTPRFRHELGAGIHYSAARFELDAAFPAAKAALEFDGPSHFAAAEPAAVCEALGSAGSLSAPRVFHRRDAALERAIVAYTLRSLPAGPLAPLPPLSHAHKMRVQQLALLGWRVVSVSWLDAARLGVKGPAPSSGDDGAWLRVADDALSRLACMTPPQR